MMIVIEGPDASGKSTLANALAIALGRRVQSSEGPEQHENEMAERLERYATLPENVIFDRHPAVSDPIYAYALQRPLSVSIEHIRKFYDKKPFFIYCEPPSRSLPHQIKPHDTPEHIHAVLTNRHRISQAYHAWAIANANIIHRIGDPVSRVVHYVTDFVQDIADFHEKFGLTHTGLPQYLDPAFKNFRTCFMAEELCEYAGFDSLTTQLVLSAFKEKQDDMISLHDQFDALIDLVYVALGTAYLHGFKFTEGWVTVHAANMRKQRAQRASDSKRDSQFDVIKPEGWTPPDLSHLLIRPVA